MKTDIKSIHAAFNLMKRISKFDLVLPSMIEQTEEPVQIHVGRTFQKVLLQRVLEVVDSFIRILQKVILEDCLKHICISGESAVVLSWVLPPIVT